MILYISVSEPKPETEALKNYSGKFLRVRTMKDRGPDEDESQFIRRKCMEDNSAQYAFITFLHTHDYIMPRGAEKNERNQLQALLSINEFRFAPGVLVRLYAKFAESVRASTYQTPRGACPGYGFPCKRCGILRWSVAVCHVHRCCCNCSLCDFAGIVLPVFEFGKFDMGLKKGSQLYPLRHFKDCNYFGHQLMTRTIANSYYVEEAIGQMDYKFVYGMLPVTDSRMPWVPQLLDIPTDDDRRIFPTNTELSGSMLESQMKRFHLSKPFGQHLAVFSFPPETAVPLPGEEWRHRLRQFITQRHSTDPSCREALQAADACCSWEKEEQ